MSSYASIPQDLEPMKVCKQKEREDIKVPNQSDAFLTYICMSVI